MELSNDVGRKHLVERSQRLGISRTPWQHWPLWRLLGVLAMFGAIAVLEFGLTPHNLRQVPLGVLTVVETGLTLSLFSGLLGAAVLAAYIVLPLAFIARANNRFFDAGEYISHRVIRLDRPRLRWGLAYAIELALFLGLFYGGRFALLRLGLRL